MLKKSIQDFFNYDLSGMNPSKSHKSLDFSSLAIGTIHQRTGLWLARKITFL